MCLWPTCPLPPVLLFQRCAHFCQFSSTNRITQTPERHIIIPISMGLPKHFAQSSDDHQGQYIDNWRHGAINWATVSQYSDKFCIMANSIETNSTKSSVIAGKTVSLKKSVRKGAKAITQPFKKLKKAISTASIHLQRSHFSTTVSSCDNEGVDPGNESSTDSQGDGSRSEPEVELTPQEELSMSFSYYLVVYINYICVRGTPGALALAHLHVLQTGCRFPVPRWPAFSLLHLCCSQMQTSCWRRSSLPRFEGQGFYCKPQTPHPTLFWRRCHQRCNSWKGAH